MKYILIIILFISTNHTLLGQECYTNCHSTKKNYNFKLLKKEGLNIDTNLVKVSGVYITKFEGGMGTYEFIRFFENGRVFLSCGYCSYPTIEELNNLNYGDFGYYIIKDGEVKVEKFSSYVRYYYHFFDIENLKLIPNGNAQRKCIGEGKREASRIKKKVYYTFVPCNVTTESFW
jgi:hypothetical protein